MTKEWQAKFYMAFGKKLKEIMADRGLTVYDVAKMSGQQFHTVNRIAQGNGFQFHNVVWLRDYLGINVNEVLATMGSVTEAESREAQIITRQNISFKRRAARGGFTVEVSDLI